MNTKLTKNAKDNFEKDLFKLMRHKVPKNRKKKELFSVRTKLLYKKKFSDNLLATKMKRI